jgi:hypothetical protein
MNRVILLAVAITVAVVPLMLLNQTASATQITSRSVLISSAQASATANYTFTFTPGSTTQIQSMIFQACTTALGTCTAPTGINLSGGTITKGGTWGGATNFTKDTTTNPTLGTPAVNCTTVSNLCLTRVDTTVQTTVAHSIIDTGAVNQNSSNCSSAANCTFFVRVFSYSDTAYTTAVDSGTVAGSTTQLFTVNAAIQEVLTFCVGATTIDNATSAPPACASISGTSLNLGTLDSAHINVSPVASVNGDSNNGIAELSTNATNGTTVAYDSIQQSGTLHLGTLRVSGATCVAGTPNTDQCINAIGTTKAAIVTGTEAYGMTIAGVDCAATTAYGCLFTSGTYNLKRNANYNCQGTDVYISTEHDQITGTSGCSYAWDETGTTQTIASSTSPNGPVDKEALILKFAATPNIVTPTGSYTAKADFVATPTF